MEERTADMPRFRLRLEVQVVQGPGVASARLREPGIRRVRLGVDQGAVFVAGLRREREGEPVWTRYLRFTGLESHNGDKWSSMAEIVPLEAK